MRVVLSGSTGLVGVALAPLLRASGHDVQILVRPGTPPGPRTISWDPERGTIEAAKIEGADAIVHLAGESIAGGRWTEDRKRRIRESRVAGTRLIAETIARFPRKPAVLVCASAIGYYGPRGDEPLDELASNGTGFLADVCRDWEIAADPARGAGIRVVHMRFGVILSKDGGALAKMLPPFRMGVAGRFGTGKQWMSWITLEDTVLAVQHALTTSSVAGPVNTTAPNPVTNQEFTKTLGRVLGRPTVFPMPPFIARLAFGEMADSLLLTGQRVEPRRLLATGFGFKDPALEPALRRVLAR